MQCAKSLDCRHARATHLWWEEKRSRYCRYFWVLFLSHFSGLASACLIFFATKRPLFGPVFLLSMICFLFNFLRQPNWFHGAWNIHQTATLSVGLMLDSMWWATSQSPITTSLPVTTSPLDNFTFFLGKYTAYCVPLFHFALLVVR